MATRKGLWDETLVPDGWFSPSQQVVGWFDRDEIDDAAVPAEGSGVVDGVGALVGAGSAAEGSGDVAGVGTLVGAGGAAEGTGSTAGVGTLVGEGAVPAAGGGSIGGVGALQGAGGPTAVPDTHDGFAPRRRKRAEEAEREREERRKSDRDELRQALADAIDPPAVAAEMREAVVSARPVRRLVLPPRPPPDAVDPRYDLALDEAAWLAELDDEETLLALLG